MRFDWFVIFKISFLKSMFTGMDGGNSNLGLKLMYNYMKAPRIYFHDEDM